MWVIKKLFKIMGVIILIIFVLGVVGSMNEPPSKPLTENEINAIEKEKNCKRVDLAKKDCATAGNFQDCMYIKYRQEYAWEAASYCSFR